MSLLYYYIDIIFIPLSLLFVHKEQRGWTIGFIISCMIMMRLQVEVMISIDGHRGLSPFMNSPVFDRALITYSVFYVVYFLLAYYSPKTQKHIYMASTISIFFMAFFISSLILLL